MAVIEALQAVKATLKLDNGVTPSGATQTVNLSLGSLDKNAWDNDKAMNIEMALESVLSKSVVSFVKTTDTSLVMDE